MINLPNEDQPCKDKKSNQKLALDFLQARTRTRSHSKVRKVQNKATNLKRKKSCISEQEIVGRTFDNWICFAQEMIHAGKCRYGFKCKKCGYTFYGLSRSSYMKVLHTCNDEKSLFHKEQGS